MRADRMFRNFLGDHIRNIHRTRVTAVFTAVAALVRGGELALSRLGRAIAATSSVKHGIKRIDRLYGNAHLADDRLAFYRGIAAGVLRDVPRPIIVIDWTEVGRGMRVLAAAVACSGRSRVRPILITDAGFRAPWIRQVLTVGWDYVARIRGRAYIRPIGSDAWVHFDQLYTQARPRASDLGRCSVTRYMPYTARVVIVRKRHKQWNPASRRVALDARVRQEVEAAREPWVLSTSLDADSADAVAAMYAKRMQIEETFRDAKSWRFGWALEGAWTERPERVDVMLLLAALASLLVLMIGIAAEDAALQRNFQANTVRNRRVLALTTLGRLVLLHEARSRTLLEFTIPLGMGG